MSEGFMLNGISNEHVNFHLRTIIYLCPHLCSPIMLFFVYMYQRVTFESFHFQASELVRVKRE